MLVETTDNELNTQDFRAFDLGSRKSHFNPELITAKLNNQNGVLVE